MLFIAALVVLTRLVWLLLGVAPTHSHEISESIAVAFNSAPGNVIENSISAGPLYVFFFGLLTFVFKNTVVISIVLAGILLFLQSSMINSIFQRNSSLPENTYIPSMLYVLLMSTHAELLFLSPILLANTFFLLVIDKVLIHLKFRGTEENILSSGFLLGLAALCYTPYAMLLILTIVMYIIYSSTLVRRYFLLLYGFTFCLLICWIYYLLFRNGQEFLLVYLEGIFSAKVPNIAVVHTLLIIIGLPVLLSLLGAAQGIQGISLTNHQIVTQRTMVWLLLFGCSILWLDANEGVSLAYSIAIPVTFFTTHFLLTRNKKWVAEVLFLLITISSIVFLFYPIDQFSI